MAHKDIARLRTLTGEKWNQYPDDVIPAWIADMDLEPAPFCVDSTRALIDRGDFGYNYSAVRKLPEVFAHRQKSRYGWDANPDAARLFCDVLQAVEVLLWLSTKPGDSVVMLTPIYHPFFKAIQQTGCHLKEAALNTDDWSFNAENLEAAIDSTTKVILFCNPHNPTGRVYSLDELNAIAEIAQRHNLLVISDEIWADLTYAPAKHIPFASVSADAAKRTVTVTAASKAFNLAGLRCAVAHLGHPDIQAKVRALPDHFLGAVSSIGAEATLSAWTQGDEWLAQTVNHLKSNRDHLMGRIASELPEATIVKPDATYLAWLDLNVYGLGDEPAAHLLSHAHIALSRGLDFGTSGAGFVRINFATTRPVLDEIIDRLVTGVRQ